MGSDGETVICCGLFLLGIGVLYFLAWLSDNWSRISQWLPATVYALLIIIITILILFELKKILDSTLYTSLFSLLSAGILIIIVIASISSVIHAQPNIYPPSTPKITPSPTITPTYSYLSTTPSPTIIPTYSYLPTTLPIKTISPSIYSTIKPVTTIMSTTPSSSNNNDRYTTQTPITTPTKKSAVQIADQILVYSTPVKINSVKDLTVGDIIQEDPSDSAYYQNGAKYIQKIDSPNDKVVIQELVRDSPHTSFYLLGDPTTQSIFSSALVRNYPNRIGHAEGTLPSKVLIGSGEGSTMFVWGVYPYGS